MISAYKNNSALRDPCDGVVVPFRRTFDERNYGVTIMVMPFSFVCLSRFLERFFYFLSGSKSYDTNIVIVNNKQLIPHSIFTVRLVHLNSRNKFVYQFSRNATILSLHQSNPKPFRFCEIGSKCLI